MTEEEWKAWEIQRAGQMNPTPKPSLEARLDWLEEDSTAQRRAILQLERQVKLLRIGGGIVAAVAGWLLGRSFT